MELQKYIECFCDLSQSLEQRNVSYSFIREAFLNKSVTFLDFVDSCSELNSPDDSTRKRSILLLSRLFREEAIDFDCGAAQVFIDYFIKRLNDFAITEEIVKGIQVLINRFPSLLNYTAVPFVQYISSNMKVGTLKYTARRLIYSLLLQCLTSSSLHTGDDLIGKAIVEIVENEKDPRGVVQVCKIIETTLQQFPHISNNTLNDLVMLGVGYFPVTYITPPLVMGNKDIVTSEEVKMAVIHVLIATRRCIPLVLPFMETSLRDSSPNSKSQAALALHELVQVFGWSRMMCEDSYMTEGEEQRWSDLLFTEYIESSEDSEEERILLETLTSMMSGDNGIWRERWMKKGLESILRSPVSTESTHLARLLRNGCYQEPSFLSTCFKSLFSVIEKTQDQDIQNGLLSVLFTILLPHSSTVLQSYLQPVYSTLLSITQTALSHITIISYAHFPKDALPLLLGFCMLVSFEEKMNNEEKMKLYIESLVHCSISNVPDLLHLLHLLVASPYDSLLLKQCLHMISLEETEEKKTAFAFVSQLLQEQNVEMLIHVLKEKEGEYNMKERLCIAKSLLNEIINNPSYLHLQSDLIWILLEYCCIDECFFLHYLFLLYSIDESFLLLLPQHSFSMNQSVIQSFIQFIQLTKANDSSLPSFIQSFYQNPLIHEYLHYLFIHNHPILSTLLTISFPSLATLHSSFSSLDSSWIQSNPFFLAISNPVAFLYFEEYIKADTVDTLKKSLVVEWSLKSLLLEQSIQSSLLSQFSATLQLTTIHLNLCSSDFNLLINKLIQSNPIDEVNILLALNLLSYSNQLMKKEELQELRIHVIMIALSNHIAIENSLKELLLVIQENAASIMNYLDSLFPMLLSLANTSLQDIHDPIYVMLSLRIIKTLADLPLNVVFKYTSQVTKGLIPVLDSKQRVIREYAARIRNLWLMIHSLVCFYINKHTILILIE